ncbi:acyl carrier protein [Sphingomonas humi]|uniref:Acyl carrier protein n=1 Tax=Sphingomonas humi TaxID=335630 RepID=A0ABP7SA74_9SPHN
MDRPVDALIASVLKIDPASITDDLAYGDIPEWSSLAHVNLMLALEAQTGTTIDEDTMVSLLSVQDIRDYVTENQAR